MHKPREVADYLKDHPEFLAEHPHLLAVMAPPPAAQADPDPEPIHVHARIHARRERALREREDRRQARLDLILDAVRGHQDLAHGQHPTAVSLQDPDALNSAAGDAPGLLVKTRFDVADVAVFLSVRQRDFPPQVDYAFLRQRVARPGSVCDDRVSRKPGAALFPDVAVASCAFIPITHRQTLHGVMVPGSADRECFRPDMGVLIFDRLGQWVGACLAGRGLV